MPLYEYECADCGATEEVLLPAGKATKTRYCEVCGGRGHRKISRTNFRLKGVGWYNGGHDGQTKIKEDG